MGTTVESLPQATEMPDYDRAEREARAVLNGLHEQSLGLRKMYAKWVLGIVIAQILAINTYFVLDSVGVIPGTYYPFNPPSDVFKVFAVSVFASVIALAFVVLYSLFPGEGKGFWGTIADAIFKRGG